MGQITHSIVRRWTKKHLLLATGLAVLVCGGEAIANGDGRLAFTVAGVLVFFVALLSQRPARLSPPRPIPAK